MVVLHFVIDGKQTSTKHAPTAEMPTTVLTSDPLSPADETWRGGGEEGREEEDDKKDEESGNPELGDVVAGSDEVDEYSEEDDGATVLGDVVSLASLKQRM